MRPCGGLLSLAAPPCFFLLNFHTDYWIVCVSCQFLKRVWQQEDVNCLPDQASHLASLVLDSSSLLGTSDLTYSLGSSTIIFPILISCCANLPLDGIHFPEMVPVEL